MKKSYLFLIAAIVFAILVWVIERPDKGDVGDFTPFKLYKSFNKDDVDKIEVSHLISGSVLTKTGDEWQVSEIETEIGKQLKKENEKSKTDFPKFKADTEKIENVIKKLGDLETTALVSTNPEKQTTYQVAKLGKRVKVYDKSGKVMADLFIGKNGPDMFSTYVRREGEDEVYLVGSHIGAVIPADVMSWRDKKIWRVKPEDIKGVEVERGLSEGFVISKNEDGIWQLTSPQKEKLDPKKVQKFLKDISKLDAERFAFVFDKTETGLEKPKLKLTIETSSGRKNLLVGDADKQGYVYARLESNGNEIYLLNSNFDKKIPSSWQEFINKSN